MRTLSAILLAAALLVGPLLVGGASHASAGPLKAKASAEVEALAKFSGHVAATVLFCGGDDKEIDYFTSLIRKWVVGAGAQPEEWLDFMLEMGEARQAATPRGRDCTDDGGMENSGKLEKLRQAMIAAAAAE